MDLPLTGRCTSNVPSPAAGGGLVSFEGQSAAELQREADRVLTEYGDVNVVPCVGDPDTPATMIRGMNLTVSSSGTLFVCELQIEPDETEISNPTYPIEQQCPVNATVGQFGAVGWSALQFIEFQDRSELARLATWATRFWNAQKAAHGGIVVDHDLLYEVAMACPTGKTFVCALLWSFQDIQQL